jgi:hypothetical protein
MKKLFIAALLVVSVVVEAKLYEVTTTCGVVGTINMSDNATAAQIAAAASQYNYNQCGVRPTKVILTLTP